MGVTWRRVGQRRRRRHRVGRLGIGVRVQDSCCWWRLRHRNRRVGISRLLHIHRMLRRLLCIDGLGRRSSIDRWGRWLHVHGAQGLWGHSW